MKPNPAPSDIAREAIKLLAGRKLPPTPENYRRAYAEVAGLPATTKLWGQAVRDLLRQWDTHQQGLTQARKREMLERVLLNFGENAEDLCGKIAKLARSWADSPEDIPLLAEGEAPAWPAADTPQPDQAPAGPDYPEAPATALAASLARLAQTLIERWPDLAERLAGLARGISSAGRLLPAHLEDLEGVWREALVRAEDEHELLAGMQRLVKLLFDNVASLVGEDTWLRGQLVSMGALISGHLNYHALYEAERGLQEIVAKQGRLKDNLQDAKDKLKHLISSFIDRIGEISTSTGTYQERLTVYTSRIVQARDIRELGDVIEGLTTEMGDIQNVLRRSHEELMEARSHVVQAELRIVALEKELDQVSNLVREDQLTGALNRRGLEETFNREVARAQRLGAPLSLALLDIDHFKRLNDSLGHQAGDQALVHLAKVVRELLRPTDSLARYGGEEFLVLLPNTGLDEAVHVLERLQRELTRQFFLHDNEKVLITFSAGVALMRSGESREQAIARADAAMYRAKAAGRNRVEREIPE